MDIIKDINKLIIKKIVGIVFIIGFLVFATFDLHNKNAQDFLAAIIAAENMNYVNFYVKNPIQYELYPISDNDALNNLEPCIIVVNNETYSNELFKLVLKINKNSTIDYRYLHININDNVYALSELERLDNDLEYVFVIQKDYLVASSREYEFRIWLNTLANNEMQNKELNMEFDIIEETVKL